jgi:glycerate-2-kinase
VPDPTTYHEALAVLDRFGGRGAYPASAVRLLEAGESGRVPETPKPGDPRLASTLTRLIGSRLDALAGAARAASAAGYEPIVIEEPVVGEARWMGPAHVGRMLELAGRTRAAWRPFGQ